MLELERKNDKVYCNGVKLRINKQASKGPGNEVVNVEGLEGSNGQKWVSLSRLHEGINTIETTARQVSTAKYQLTLEEQKEVNELQARIDTIINNAKSRYVAKPNFSKIDPSKLSDEEKAVLIANLKQYLAIAEDK